MIGTFRKHLLVNSNLIQLLDGKQAIYYIEKDKSIIVDYYILFKDKLISKGFISEYQVEVNIIGKDLNKLIDIEKELIKYLNDIRGEKIIKDEEATIRNITVLNGGGTIRNEEGDWLKVIFFLCKL